MRHRVRNAHRAESIIPMSTYLDLEILINLHNFAKNGYVLHETGEFPAVANLLKQTRFLCWLLHRGSNRIGAAALSRTHCGGTAGQGRGCW